MQVFQNIKTALRRNRLFRFNQLDRDAWIIREAKLIPPGSSVIDVGAGSCPYKGLFRHCRYVTQDFQQLESHQLLDQVGYGTIDYVCDVTGIPCEDASFDVVLCTEVLEHVPDPISTVKELGRILKPGGVLLVSAPLGSGLHQVPYHFYGGYTPFWYRHFLPKAGFRAIRVEANGGFFRFYGQESLRFAQRTFPMKMQGPKLVRIACIPLWFLSLPWFALITPVICRFLDRLDTKADFTVGYHVVATKV